MLMHNAEIAGVFDEMADLLALQEENPFRIRAYRRAAQVIRGLSRELTELVERGEDLDALPGIGPDLAAKITELVTSGRLKALERLRRQVPPGLVELMRMPGLGPKRVRALHLELKVRDRDDLARVVAAGKVAKLRGFGPKLIERLGMDLRVAQPAERRWLRSVAAQFAEPLARHLRRARGVGEVVIAGSYRRGRETVGDIDLLVCSADAPAVVESLRAYDEVARWVASGPKRLTVVLRSGLQVDVRISDPACFGAALHYFTGSKAHNIHVRRLARDRGLKINEYGVFRGRRLLAGDTEKSVFAAVRLPWIPPELREDQGEIEAASAGRLPALVTRQDLRGDLHSHTNASDGSESLKAMALAARAAGLEYLAITDHSRYLGVVKGQDARRLRSQMEAIDRLNDALDGITLLKGAEVDILEDGKLALPDDVLAELDVVVGAVHSHFELSEQKQTARVLRAMEHRAFSILSHPMTRLIGERPAVALDLERICRAAKSRPCFLELDAQPQRLDLDDTQCRMAREHGVLVSIASDAHAGAQFENLEYGAIQARRGWLTADDVLNSRRLGEVRALLRSTFI
jgi:DNA polymerase (family 10)